MIMKHLTLKKKETYTEHEQPLGDKTHLTIFPKEVPFSLTILADFVNDNNYTAARVVVFCRQLEDCGRIYAELQYQLGPLINYVQVRHLFIYINDSLQ